MKVLLVGAGKLGFRLAKSLVDENCDITILDNDDKVIENVNNSLDVLTVNANALDFQILEELDLASYDLLIASTTSDEANVLISTLSKRLGVNRVIARVRNPEYHSQIRFIMNELGIDEIINPDHATAVSIEKYLLKKYLLVSDEFANGKVKLVDFHIGSDANFIDKKIKELKDLPQLLIAAITRDGKTIIPNGETILREKDSILIVGARDDIESFDKNHSDISKHKSVKKVIILGGGKLGLYLGLLLDNDGIETTIIERDPQRCNELMEKLPNTMIINADGTDLNILNEEMIDSYDAFVAATGIDETNILMALTVKQLGVYKSVAKLSRSNYDKLIDKLNLDAAFNTSLITASAILKFVRGHGFLSVNLMQDGETEFTEIILDKDTNVLNKPLKDLDLPKEVLITSMVRGSTVIIPNGNTELKEGDRIIVFCRHEKIQAIKKYFNLRNNKGGFFSELRDSF